MGTETSILRILRKVLLVFICVFGVMTILGTGGGGGSGENLPNDIGNYMGVWKFVSVTEWDEGKYKTTTSQEIELYGIMFSINIYLEIDNNTRSEYREVTPDIPQAQKKVFSCSERAESFTINGNQVQNEDGTISTISVEKDEMTVTQEGDDGYDTTVVLKRVDDSAIEGATEDCDFFPPDEDFVVPTGGEGYGESSCVQCCKCNWTCHFSNQYGSGTQTGSATISSMGCLDCAEECYNTASDGDCVGAINLTRASECSDSSGNDVEDNTATDNDGDGYSELGGDCDDTDINIHPFATEVCGDGKDNNCNEQIDEGCNTDNQDGDKVCDGEDTSCFAGNYSITFEGILSSFLEVDEFTIDDDGNISGTFTSTIDSTIFNITGTVNVYGNFQIIDSSSTFTAEGTISESGEINGEYMISIDSLSGTLSGNRL